MNSPTTNTVGARGNLMRVVAIAALTAMTIASAGAAVADDGGNVEVARTSHSRPTQVASGLQLARYNFNECDVADSSGNGLNGGGEGSVGCGPGVEGNALVFDGGGFASVAAESLGATSSEPRTISMWVNPTSIPFDPEASGLISKYLHFDVGQSNFYASLYQRSDGQIVTRLTGNGTDVLEATAGTLNEWQHYAFVISAGGSSIYRNGSLVASGTLTLNEALTSQPLRIGNIAGAGDSLFRGMLDDVRIYRKALTAGQIRELASGR